ncbi:hypothetical protein [Photobacterium damselae]|uniref:hypothetical protein n=1 Tax=Photobacterium damselae TaxID=38293 RepID=UPI00187ED375|nr:hypothetical protein [Photobacterium damselae]
MEIVKENGVSYRERKRNREIHDRLILVPSQEAIDSLYEDCRNDTTVIEPIKQIQRAERTDGDTERLIRDLEDRFDARRMLELFEKTKKDVVASIVPLGLGAKLAEHDQLGGNVNTTHNVRNGVYATEEAKEDYDSRGDYDQYQYHAGNRSYNETKRDVNERLENGTVINEATGKAFEVGADGKHHVAIDHVIPASTVHDDPAARLARMDTNELANIKENLKPIDGTVNSSKGSQSNTEYVSGLDKKIELKKQRIETLKAKDLLSDQEQRELANAERYVEKNSAVDKERMRQSEKDAQAAINERVDDCYYKSKEFRKESLGAATKTAKRAGITAALAKVLSLFASGVIDELIDLWKNGKQLDSNFSELKIRMKRVVKRCVAEWKSIVGSGLFGAISGFLSELVTIYINTIKTTSARMVTLIREGGFALLRALKLLFFRPEGMSMIEAADASLKVFAVGSVAAGGILVEQLVDSTLQPILPFGASLVSSIVVGALVAITSCVVVYLIDKADLFKVIDNQRQDFVTNSLNEMIEYETERTKRLLSDDLPAKEKTPHLVCISSVTCDQ